jgi:hypothetical protein
LTLTVTPARSHASDLEYADAMPGGMLAEMLASLKT